MTSYTTIPNLITDAIESLVETLDVSASKYEEADSHYQAVGKWLEAPDTELAKYKPEIYVQGSFRLGTVVKPLRGEEYDVDLVCLLKNPPSSVTQQQVKKLVGDRLKDKADYRRMLGPEKRRCWTLNYAEGSNFHLDILPAIPNYDIADVLRKGVPYELAQRSICITDKEKWHENTEWPQSNPKGYSEWFTKQMAGSFEKQRFALASAIQAKVEDIPEYQVRTPLQKIIQLLKRHRDVMFEGSEHKPISIIITTLAAKSYDNQDDIWSSFVEIVANMPKHIEIRNGVYWVENPVNPKENFADRWESEPKKAEAFSLWMDSIRDLINKLQQNLSVEEIGTMLKPLFGGTDVDKALKKITNLDKKPKSPYTTSPLNPTTTSSVLSNIVKVPLNLFNGNLIPWKKEVIWPMRQVEKVQIQASYRIGSKSASTFQSNSNPLPKGCSLKFIVNTPLDSYHSVWWQVVNTGDEAIKAGGCRGGFLPGELEHSESTLYRGSHSIECFIVKDGVCIASSGPFIVNIS